MRNLYLVTVLGLLLALSVRAAFAQQDARRDGVAEAKTNFLRKTITVKAQLSDVASRELARIVYEAPDSEHYRCAFSVRRAKAKKGAIPARWKKAEIVCANSENGATIRQDLSRETFEHWGARDDRVSFTMQGAVAEKWFDALSKEARALPEILPQDATASALSVCDPYGVYCREGYILHAQASSDSIGQIACHRGSEMIKAHSSAIDPDAYPSVAAYYGAVIDEQIAAGVRKITDLNCVLIAP